MRPRPPRPALTARAGGDQRDRARERNAKLQKDRNGGGNQEGLSAAQRRERYARIAPRSLTSASDAAIMKQKQEAALAKKPADGGGQK